MSGVFDFRNIGKIMFVSSYALGLKASVVKITENFLQAEGKGLKSAQFSTTEQSESTALLIGFSRTIDR